MSLRVLVLISLVLCVGPRALSSQQPPVPPPPVADSAAAADSSGAPDPVQAIGDTTRIPDSLAVHNLPSLSLPRTAGSTSGIWRWDRVALLQARGFTLAELLNEIPGLTLLRGGDYGQPVAVASFGLAGGGVRVLVDGFAMLPLEGSQLDLSKVSLAGVQSVEVRRDLSGVTVELTTVRFEDPRPYSLIEVGTGDLETNVFRGTFGLPRAARGALALVIDRIDTAGREGNEPGTLTATWLQYTLARDDRFGLQFDVRRRSVGRGDVLLPSDLRRSDWAVRARSRVGERVVVGAHYGRSSLSATDPTLGTDVRLQGQRITQVGLEGRIDVSHLFAGVQIHSANGAAVWDDAQNVEVGAELERLGSASLLWRREGWAERSVSRAVLGARTASVAGFSAFAQIERGDVALGFISSLEAPALIPDSTAGPGEARGPAFMERRATRVGAAFERWGASLTGARISVEADSVFPSGLPFDGGPLALPGGRWEGWEAEAILPLLPGLSLRGALVQWDSSAVGSTYRPDRSYEARLRFHDTFLPTGNFELLVDVGVRERGPMDVFEPSAQGLTVPLGDGATEGEIEVPGTTTVPFAQSWFARMQMRIVTVRIFVEWENLTQREFIQDFPGRLLPQTRALYGVRWTLWN